jgi:hypothetical protein
MRESIQQRVSVLTGQLNNDSNKELIEDFDGDLGNVTVTEDEPLSSSDPIEITIEDLDAAKTVDPNID